MNGSGSNYNNNGPSGNPPGDVMSWVVIIICLVAFWPLGLILLLKKIGETSKSRNQSSYGAKYQQRPYYYQQNQQPRSGPTAGQYYKPPQQQQQHTGGQVTAGYTYYHTQTGQAKSYAESKKAKKEAKKQFPARNLAVALTVLAVVLGIMGAIFLSSGLSSIAVAGLSAGSLGAAIFGGFSLLGALISTILRGIALRRISRFNRYAAVIGGRDVVSISELSKTVGEPPKKTRKSLQEMIDSGYFGETAYIDSGLDSFVVSREAAEKHRQKSEAASDVEKTEGGNQFVATVNELHLLRSQTSDPVICGKIERIEKLTVKIFRTVEEKPEKLPKIRRFMNYYLPTTLKLLHSYQTLERQGIDGENIMAAKKDIERILDTLAVGYEQQLDNLFMSDKLDISAEVNVLENLLEQDGLAGEGNIMKPAGGN